jgi:hypothetical protein
VTPALLTTLRQLQEGIKRLNERQKLTQSIDREHQEKRSWDESGNSIRFRDRGEVTSRAAQVVSERMGRSRIHKASSAESILKHCLRQLGYTRAWRENRLTGRQHLKLLEAIRQYGRAWMRHEAESFFEHWGRDESSQGSRAILEAESITGDVFGPRNDIGIRDRITGQTGEGCPAQRTTEGMERSAKTNSTQEAINQAAQGTHERALADRILFPLRRWFDRNIGFMQELMFAAAQSQNGPPPLTPDTAKFVDELVEVQRHYLDQFYQDLIQRTPEEITDILGPPLPGIKPPYTKWQAVARAEQYGSAAWQGGQKVMRRRQKESGGARWERRILGHPRTEHCSDCPPIARLGWQPIGTLPDIGDTECGGMCYCHFEYSSAIEMPTGKEKPEKKKPRGKKPQFELEGTQEAIDQLLSNPQFNEAMKQLKITMKVHVGSGD